MSEFTRVSNKALRKARKLSPAMKSHLVGKADRSAFAASWAYGDDGEHKEARPAPSLPVVAWMSRPLIPPTSRELKGA